MDVTELATKQVDNYIDMGCFRNPELVRPAMLEGFEMGYREAKKQIVTDFRMDELDAVMYSVDKWLEGDALLNNPATRAADAREIALKAIEAEAARADRAESALKEAAGRAIAFVNNNYNARGEWDDVAFDNLRAAIMRGKV